MPQHRRSNLPGTPRLDGSADASASNLIELRRELTPKLWPRIGVEPFEARAAACLQISGTRSQLAVRNTTLIQQGVITLHCSGPGSVEAFGGRQPLLLLHQQSGFLYRSNQSTLLRAFLRQGVFVSTKSPRLPAQYGNRRKQPHGTPSNPGRPPSGHPPVAGVPLLPGSLPRNEHRRVTHFGRPPQTGPQIRCGKTVSTV